MNYSDEVVDHFENPRNVGSLDKDDPNVGVGIVGSPACGDVFKLDIKINPETMIIEDICFRTMGCGTAIASASLTTERIKGKTLEEAMKLTNCNIAKELSLPEVKIHCSCLAVNAFHAAVKNWEEKQKERK